MGAVGVSGELDNLVCWQTQDLLESAADVLEDVLTLLKRSALSSGNIALTTTWDALANSAGPNTNTVKALADVDDNTHDLSVILVLQCLTNGGEHNVEPDVVDWHAALVLELIRPLATVLVLSILPLRPDALLEQVVIGLQGEIRSCGNVVLRNVSNGWPSCCIGRQTYVNAPELLNRVECDDLLEQVGPVVALTRLAEVFIYATKSYGTFPDGGLVNQRVHLCINGCLTLKFSAL